MILFIYKFLLCISFGSTYMNCGITVRVRTVYTQSFHFFKSLIFKIYSEYIKYIFITLLIYELNEKIYFNILVVNLKLFL